MGPLDLYVHPHGDPVVIEAVGDLCLSTATALQRAVRFQAAGHPGCAIDVDLQAVEFCDIAGLRAVDAVRDWCLTGGVHIRVERSPAVLRVGMLVGSIPHAHAA